jgi:adenine-specific DNA-methyltransferase
MFFNVYTDHLTLFKERLLRRKVKKFTEDNWWMWGRSHHVSKERRVYVPVKTKQKTPFFTHDCIHYDGTLLGVFFKDTVTAPPEKVMGMLNEVDWDELGFRVGGRFIFSQNALESVLLPKDFTSLVSSSSCHTEDQRCKNPSLGGRVRTV